MAKSRSLRIAMMVALAAAVSACWFSSPTPTAAPATPPPATPTPAPTRTPKVLTYKDMVVGFIQTGSESPWRVANTASFTDTATADGITLKVFDSQDSFQNQIAGFHQFISDLSVNVIVLDPVDTTGYDAVLKQAKAAGKVVVIEDLKIDADPSLYTSYVGPDFVAEGQNAATAMCGLLTGFTADKHNVVEITGAVGDAIGMDRGEGFRDKMGDCGITIPAGFSQSGDWSVAQSKSVMTAMLKKTKNIQGVFAQDDEEAIGAIQAIKAAGLKPGKDIMVVGIDATADGFNALIAGDLGADIEYNPLLAPQVYDTALNGLKGYIGIPKWIPSKESTFLASQGAAALQAILATRTY
jgi:simple sugar transport system substrate-binding protein